MDWANDNVTCCQDESSKVFRYGSRPTSVVRAFPGPTEPMVRTMNSDDDWNDWFKNKHPKPDGSQAGLVLILARRYVEPKMDLVKRKESDDWIESIHKVTPDVSHDNEIPSPGGQRNLRNLPFSEEMFKTIAKEFHIHDSITRSVSRADVPDFTGTKLEMRGKTAHVFNTRTSNAWDGDLAASTTYFPDCNLTFSIVFGCTLSIEAEILTRLRKISYEICHPLLISCIIVEIERKRHLPIVEEQIDEVETRILELNNDPELLDDVKGNEKVALKEAKRSAWLDMLYLRNQLLSWGSCLKRLDKQTRQLNHAVFGEPYGYEEIEGDDSSSEFSLESNDRDRTSLRVTDAKMSTTKQLGPEEADITEAPSKLRYSHGVSEISILQMRRTGKKIQGRLQEIMKDYNEKIQECTSAIEGMVMSTQWAQGETNVEIALATGQDSRHMRSIALVTMIFLPGTFFASIFSMGFFDFKESSGSVIISQLFWLYVVLAVGFTGLTVGAWYYLGVYRFKKHRSLTSGLSRSCCSLRVLDLLLSRKTE